MNLLKRSPDLVQHGLDRLGIDVLVERIQAFGVGAGIGYDNDVRDHARRAALRGESVHQPPIRPGVVAAAVDLRGKAIGDRPVEGEHCVGFP